ncbi:MAG: hypothetical protein RIQ33_785 [Bacteroidota bacterium]|jgi:hypothetical protein
MKKKYFYIILFFVFSVFQKQNLYAQKFEAKASIDTTHFLIGDYLSVHLKLINSNHLTTIFPEAEFDTASKFEVVNISKIDTTTQGYNRTFVYTIFDSGNYVIPPFQFLIQGKNKIDTLFTQPLSIVIKGIPVDTLKAMRPIKKPMDIPMTFREYLPYLIIIGLVLILVAAALYYLFFIRKKKPKLIAQQPEIIYTPYQKAMMLLNELEKENIMADETKLKIYYTRLTDIIREYIEHQFNIAALESTTDELMERLKYSTIDAASRLQLFELLSEADMVKFAKAKPGLNEHIAALMAARKFVEQTKPVQQTNLTT